MSLVPASIKAPFLPQVNLMPPEVASRRARGRQRGGMILAFVGLIALLMGLVFFVDQQKQAALAALQVEEDRTRALQDEIASYAEVPVIQKELDNAVSARRYAGAFEILWAPLLDDIAVALPTGVSLDSITWVAQTPIQQEPLVDSPVAVPSVGQLQISGKARTYVQVIEIESALNAVPGLGQTKIVGATLSSVNGDEYYQFSGIVSATYRALSGRFSDAWFEFEAIDNAHAEAKQALAEAADDVATAESALSGGDAGAQSRLNAATAAQADAQARLDVVEWTLDANLRVRNATYAVVDAQLALQDDPQATEDDVTAAVEGLAAARLDYAVAHETFLAYQAYAEAIAAVADANDLIEQWQQRLALAQTALTYHVDGAQARVDLANEGITAAQADLATATTAVQPASDALAPLLDRFDAFVAFRSAEAALADASAVVDDAIRAAARGEEVNVNEAAALRDIAQSAFDAAQAKLAQFTLPVVDGQTEPVDAPSTGESPGPSPSPSGGAA